MLYLPSRQTFEAGRHSWEQAWFAVNIWKFQWYSLSFKGQSVSCWHFKWKCWWSSFWQFWGHKRNKHFSTLLVRLGFCLLLLKWKIVYSVEQHVCNTDTANVTVCTLHSVPICSPWLSDCSHLGFALLMYLSCCLIFLVASSMIRGCIGSRGSEDDYSKCHTQGGWRLIFCPTACIWLHVKPGINRLHGLAHLPKILSLYAASEMYRLNWLLELVCAECRPGCSNRKWSLDSWIASS